MVIEPGREAKDKTVKLRPFWLEQNLGLAVLIVWGNRKREPQKDIFVRHPNDDNKNVRRLRVWIESSYRIDSGLGNPSECADKWRCTQKMLAHGANGVESCQACAVRVLGSIIVHRWSGLGSCSPGDLAHRTEQLARVSYNVVSNKMSADRFVFRPAALSKPIPCASLRSDQPDFPSHPQMRTAMLGSAAGGLTAGNGTDPAGILFNGG
jgi:hypothetical protein